MGLWGLRARTAPPRSDVLAGRLVPQQVSGSPSALAANTLPGGLTHGHGLASPLGMRLS